MAPPPRERAHPLAERILSYSATAAAGSTAPPTTPTGRPRSRQATTTRATVFPVTVWRSTLPSPVRQPAAVARTSAKRVSSITRSAP